MNNDFYNCKLKLNKWFMFYLFLFLFILYLKVDYKQIQKRFWILELQNWVTQNDVTLRFTNSKGFLEIQLEIQEN